MDGVMCIEFYGYKVQWKWLLTKINKQGLKTWTDYREGFDNMENLSEGGGDVYYLKPRDILGSPDDVFYKFYHSAEMHEFCKLEIHLNNEYQFKKFLTLLSLYQDKPLPISKVTIPDISPYKSKYLEIGLIFEKMGHEKEIIDSAIGYQDQYNRLLARTNKIYISTIKIANFFTILDRPSDFLTWADSNIYGVK